MSDTYQFNLPLVQPSQAQKHVTVNEALARLDAVAQLRLFSIDTPTAPLNPQDGEAYAVPADATGDWAIHANKVAIWSNGDWVAIAPLVGWSAWVEDAGARYTYAAGAWGPAGDAIAPSGAGMSHAVVEVTHTVVAGADNTTSVIIPSHSVVSAVTARVTQDIVTDGATSWTLGVPGASGRYGSSYGLAQNSYAIGLTGQPQAYYADTPLLIEPESGNFVSGEVIFAVHLVRVEPPAAV